MSTCASYVGVYGNISILKGWCTRCAGYSFVKDGLLKCCGTPADASPEYFKRECSPEQTRRSISPASKLAQLEAQDHRCIYCSKPFGSHVIRGTKAILLKLVWDHFVPYAYSQNNHAQNYVAACHICNSIKSDMMFQTIEDASVYIHTRRAAKGYTL